MKKTAFIMITALFLVPTPGLGQAASEGTLTLEQALQLAESYSPTLEQAQASFEAQDARVTHSWLNVGPKIQADYNQVYLEKEKTASFGGKDIVTAPKESRTASITLSQPLTGALTLASYAQYEGLKRDIESQKLQLTRAQIKFNTVESFLMAQNTATLRNVAEEALTAAQKQVSDAKSLYDAGRIHRGDLLKLELFLSNAKAQLARAKALETGAMARLKSGLGIPFDRNLTLAPPTKIPTQPGSSSSEAASSRLDVKSAEIGIEVSAFSKKLARSEFFPSINAFAKVDYNLLEPVGLASSDKVSRTYGLQASWQLWNNGVRVYKVREAAQQAHIAEAMHRQALNQAKVEIVSAEADLSAAKESMDLAASSLDQAREAHRIEQVKFKAGKSSATELVLAESARTAAEGNVVSATTDHKLKILHLQKALGYDGPQFGEVKK